MLSANAVEATELRVTVKNIDVNRGGDLIVMVFGEDGFPIKHEKALLSQTKPPQRETMEFSFNVNYDELAVKVLHDENSDGKVTKNWTGIIPKEGLGFSNDQKLSIAGPPKYNKSKLFKEQYLDGVVINIIYP